jgi:hypothetical protein
MPAGDAQRTWFPEMVETLRRQWRDSMSPAQCIELRDQLDAMLETLRTQRAIQPPLIYCPNCKARHRARFLRVSVRALILAVGRFGIGSHDQVRGCEKAWKQYRREHALDLDGHPAPQGNPPELAVACSQSALER